MRPIDADALLEKMKGTPRYFAVKFDIEEMPTITEAEIRAKVIDEAMEKLSEEICSGCGSLKDRKCTYTGRNCRVSQIMLKKTMAVLEQLKEE